MAELIAKPVNRAQREYNKLVTLGGGSGGGPARTKVQALLSEAGKSLNKLAYHEAAQHLAEFPGANPWHVCFAVGLSWGHLAQQHLDFTGAAVRLIEEWNDDDLRIARKFCLERGPMPIEQSLKGAHLLFQKVVLPAQLPENLSTYRTAQDRWLGRILGPDRPPYIGAWNATAMFMVALFSKPHVAAELIEPTVQLPPGGPIFAGLTTLYRGHVLHHKPAGSELDDQGFEPGALAENNGLLHELHKGFAGWHLLDVHSGVYMLGTRLPESDQWY